MSLTRRFLPLLILLAAACDRPGRIPPADFIFTGGEVYTVNPSVPWAEAVAVRDGEFVYVGSDSGATAFIGRRTKIIPLEGRMLLPGFHDSHVHPVSGGIELGQCSLNGLMSMEELLDSIRSYVAVHPELEWIRGGGWEIGLFPDGNAHKSMLDAIESARPIVLYSADGHNLWMNSAALAKAGITADTADPPLGRIERDPDTGEPTGTLREEAMKLVDEILPPYAEKDYLDGLRRGLEMANHFGITSFQEASADEQMLEAYAALNQRGQLTARTVVAMTLDLQKGAEQVQDLVALRKKFSRRGGIKNRLRPTAVKIFADGVIEGGTAALLDPYLHKEGDTGILNLEPGLFKEIAVALDREGFQIHTHAIGDRAIRVTLDALEAAQEVNGKRDSRHHMAHIQLFAPEDIQRFRELGVIANFQSYWAYADLYITLLTEPRLGPERSRWLYPIRTMAESGATLAGGSDWSVTTMNPLDAIQVAVTHRALDDSTGTPWNPEEMVGLETMIRAYTMGGAFVNFQDEDVGSIEVGKRADLIVLDQNLFELPPHRLHTARVLLTLLDGEPVFNSPDFPIALR